MKTVTINGITVSEERAYYALIFLEKMEEKVGPDFIQTSNNPEVET